MSMVRYSAYRKKQAGGRHVWGVLRQEGRKQNFRTVGEDDDAQEKAEKLAKKLSRMEADSPDATDRFLCWHRAGEPLPLDRTVRDYARTAKDTVAASTAARYRQFAERLADRLGAIDLRLLQKEDVGRFVRAEHADGRAKDPTINACVLLRSTVLAALRTKDEHGRPHLSDDPLPQITKIARRTATDVWRPSLDQNPSVDAWTPAEARALLQLAASEYPGLYGPCLFQLSTGCRIGEVLGMRWSAVELARGEITIRLKIHNNVPGAPKTTASNRTIKIPQRLIEFLKVHRERQQAEDGWVFPAPRDAPKHWDDRKYQEVWRKLRKRADVRPLGTHAWRHLFVSNALSSDGWTPAEVAEHVGSSIKVILERYTHVIHRSRRLDFSFVDDFES
jgi:integrase